MKPIDQAVLDPGRGDSLAACVASILEVQLSDIGDLDSGNNLEQLEGALALRGYAFCFMAGDLARFRVPDWAERFCVVVGTSPRNPALGHAVVGERRSDNTGIDLAHDPHPSRDFIRTPWRGCLVLFPLESFQKAMAE